MENEKLSDVSNILDCINEAFLYLNDKFLIKYSNKATEKILKKSSNEILNHSFFDIFQNTNDTIFENKFNYVLSEKKFTCFETYYTPHNKWYEVRIYPFNSGLIIFFQNISERKKSEEIIQLQLQELEAKTAEMERFIYTVSHDLKSPLITIKGFIGFLQEDIESQNQELIKKDFERIKKAADNMYNLLEDLLELSRIGRVINNKVFFSLNDLLKEIIDLFQIQLQQKRIKLIINNELPQIYADKNRIKEVFQNLIENSIKFMGNNTAPEIEIGFKEYEKFYEFFVRDNGIGIKPEYHTKIFGLFNKICKSSEGTGLGLALVKRIIEIHNGRVWVESKGNNDGTTIFFTLPKRI
ncbi:MAG TPA: ATP-binding protein [bacterium]|nr:ATP-binding protein [bacterium]HOL48358.1 ATP-binding protein [bacterium]HPQ18016.1 ATP-binding protein [bacterium]